MSEERTTRPMLEALLEGQRQLGEQVAALRTEVAALAKNQDSLAAKLDSLAAKQDELAAKQDELAAKQDELAAKQDELSFRINELTMELRDGLYDATSKIEVFNDRLLSFETWLRKIDERLHHEIIVRTR